MNRNQIFDATNLKSEDAFKHLEQTYSLNGIDGVWHKDRFFPLSDIPDETAHPERLNHIFSHAEHEKRWELMDLVSQILEQAPLNSIERERLYLAFWRNMSLQEIGNFCGRSKSSIHESLHNAIRKIKKFVDDKPIYHNVLSEHNFI